MSFHNTEIAAPPVRSMRVAGTLRRNLMVLLALVTGVLVGAAILFLAHQRGQVVRTASERATDGAWLIGEHALRVFRVTDFVLRQAATLAAARPIEELRDDRDTLARLTALTQGLPEPGRLALLDTDGRVVVGPRGMAAVDSAAYQVLRDRRADLWIGPTVALETGFGFRLHRAIRTADGSLAGIAVAEFDARGFTDFCHTLALGENAAVGLYGQDGRVVLRQPKPEQAVGKSVAGGPVLTAAERSPHGTVVGQSRLDGVERLFAYRSIPEYGIVVGVGSDLDEMMRGWREDALLFLLVLGVACAGILVMGHLTLRALAHEEGLVAGLEETVRARTEEARHQAIEAHRANESKTKFLATASHDLRQPLQAAAMFAEVLTIRLADGPDAPVVDKLRQSVEAAQALISTLLDASTLEAGQVEPSVVAFPVAPLLASLADQMEPQAQAAGLDLRVVASSARIASDPVLLERMVRNLLVNALRYTPQGKVLLGCRRHGDRLAVCVVDTGTGVPADKLDAIFDDFTRLGDKGNGGQRGLGLGLGVVRRMAELLNHEVSVRSVPGKGSCFAVTVPLAEGARSPQR